MKRVYTIALVQLMVISAAIAQVSNVYLSASVSGTDRLSVVKNSVHIDEWHENSFLSLYGRYASKMEGITLQTYSALNELAQVDKNTSNEEAYDYSVKLIAFRYDLINLLNQYYVEIGSQFNGNVALQFLQTEALLDMIESSKVYESTPLKQYRFHAKLLSSADIKSAKCNIISRAMSLTPEEATDFYIIYNEYEEECAALLGEDYSLIGFYAGEASDYTPAIAKHLGYDFINVMKREMKLKEKYFVEIKNKMNTSLAARFLAWEDYNSLINKMYAWADAP